MTTHYMKVVCVARAGNRCANVRRGRSTLSFPIYEIGIYETRARKADGVVTWRRIGAVANTRTACWGKPSAALVATAHQYATEAGIPYLHVRHGQLATVAEKAAVDAQVPYQYSEAWG